MTVKNQEAANAIAAALSAGFTHPGNGTDRPAANFHLPGLDLRGKPTHMVESIKATLQIIGDSLVYMLENDQDFTIIPNVELKQLRADLKKANDELAGAAAELAFDCHE
jgi:hypothetical protein